MYPSFVNSRTWTFITLHRPTSDRILQVFDYKIDETSLPSLLLSFSRQESKRGDENEDDEGKNRIPFQTYFLATLVGKEGREKWYYTSIITISIGRRLKKKDVRTKRRQKWNTLYKRGERRRRRRKVGGWATARDRFTNGRLIQMNR